MNEIFKHKKKHTHANTARGSFDGLITHLFYCNLQQKGEILWHRYLFIENTLLEPKVYIK